MAPSRGGSSRSIFGNLRAGKAVRGIAQESAFLAPDKKRGISAPLNKHVASSLKVAAAAAGQPRPGRLSTPASCSTDFLGRGLAAAAQPVCHFAMADDFEPSEAPANATEPEPSADANNGDGKLKASGSRRCPFHWKLPEDLAAAKASLAAYDKFPRLEERDGLYEEIARLYPSCCEELKNSGDWVLNSHNNPPIEASILWRVERGGKGRDIWQRFSELKNRVKKDVLPLVERELDHNGNIPASETRASVLGRVKQSYFAGYATTREKAATNSVAPINWKNSTWQIFVRHGPLNAENGHRMFWPNPAKPPADGGVAKRQRTEPIPASAPAIIPPQIPMPQVFQQPAPNTDGLAMVATAAGLSEALGQVQKATSLLETMNQGTSQKQAYEAIRLEVDTVVALRRESADEAERAVLLEDLRQLRTMAKDFRRIATMKYQVGSTPGQGVQVSAGGAKPEDMTINISFGKT